MSDEAHNDNNKCRMEGSIELLYLWIGCNETGFIQEQGFNFSPNYRFDVQQSDAYSSYQLSCTVNENYPNIWNTGSIIGLTAVVGENGTGKSSLMGYLIDPDFVRPWICIYRVDGSIRVYHNMDSSKIKNTTEFEIFSNQDQSSPVFHTQTRVYISNAWNSLRTSIGRGDYRLDRLVFSVDGKKQLSEYFRRKMEDNIPAFPEHRSPNGGIYSRPQKVGNIDIDELITLHYYSHLFENESNDIPKNSIISFNFYDYLLRMTRILCEEDVHPRILEIYRNNWTTSPCYAAFFALYLEFVTEVGLDITQECNPVRFISDTFTYSVVPSGMSKQVWDYYCEAFDEIVTLEKLLKRCDSRARAVGGRRFITEIHYNKQDQRDTFVSFCHYIASLMYKPYSFVLKYIHIDTAPVSSGEQALRNIFACLQLIQPINEIFGIQSDITFSKNILLLLDEVDLYMHPEWQRSFLTLLEKRLRRAYPDKHIQLVITTHSPLVLSDIPSRNIIYLGADNNQCIVVAGPEHEETFGANLFTLLKDSFYLKKSLGEFAYSKINDIIKNLQMLKENNNSTPPCEECEKYIHLINIIGEPVIRRKLQTLYFELFPVGSHDIYEQQITDLAHVLKNTDPRKREKYKALLDKVLSEMQESSE